jgi:NADP-dependent aldehyde dehydrogenase
MTSSTLQSLDARSHLPLGEPWPASTAAEIDSAVGAADAAAASFADTTGAQRGALLRALATALEAERDTLVPLADQETALGLPRLNGELDRTAFQLRGFAVQVEAGAAHGVVDDPAVAGPPPAGHPHLLKVRVPLGPVAMFAASNFPFAFSVLGGDTASALAAGCPVVVKGHPGHPDLSRRVVALAQRVVADQGLATGVFQFVQGAAVETGVCLVQAPAIAAVAFTGSTRGGLALARIAADRPRPIPFYGELGSINPVLVLPAALARAGELAATLAASICMGCGQFCTSPGVIVVPQGEAGDGFIAALAAALQAATPHAMLSADMRAAFERGVARWRATPQLQARVDAAAAGALASTPATFLAETSAADFIANPVLHDEVFGPAALVVRTNSSAESIALLHAVGGALTVTLWGAEQASDETRAVVFAASRIAGRVLFSGVPTGVAVTTAQHHGGPFPASTAPMTTSVGYAALDRFLRPVALQEAPAWLVERRGLTC